VTSEIAESLGLVRPQGALIVTLEKESPLASAGLRPGDLLLSIEGHEIGTVKEFIYRVATNSAGARILVRYRRQDKETEVSVLLAAAPETVPRTETRLEGDNPLSGLTVVNLSPAVSEELGLQDVNSGVAVLDKGSSIGKRLGFRKGDVIVDINGQPINNVEVLSEVLAAGSDYWSLAINRNGRLLRLQVAG